MKTIKEQIDDIASDICDNYCKYRAETFDDEDLQNEHCNNCPLVNLL